MTISYFISILRKIRLKVHCFNMGKNSKHFNNATMGVGGGGGQGSVTLILVQNITSTQSVCLNISIKNIRG